MNSYYVNFELHKLPVFQQIQIKGILRVIAFLSLCSIIDIGFKKARLSFKLGLHRKLLSIIFLASGHCLESDYPIRSDPIAAWIVALGYLSVQYPFARDSFTLKWTSSFKAL